MARIKTVSPFKMEWNLDESDFSEWCNLVNRIKKMFLSFPDFPHPDPLPEGEGINSYCFLSFPGLTPWAMLMPRRWRWNAVLPLVCKPVKSFQESIRAFRLSHQSLPPAFPG
ncbi:MAG: hypothetical protein ACE15F_04170 [bacterium]